MNSAPPPPPPPPGPPPPHGMSSWHGGGGGGGSGPPGYFPGPPGPYGYPGSYQGPPPPQQAWGAGYGPGGYGSYPPGGYQAPWAFSVPPGMPVPPMQQQSQQPDNTNNSAATSNSSKSDNNSNTSTNNTTTTTANNPPLPPGPPPPAGVQNSDKQEDRSASASTDAASSAAANTTTTTTAAANTPTATNKSQDTQQQTQVQCPPPPPPMQGYTITQDYNHGFPHGGYGQGYGGGYGGYGGGSSGGWYGPNGPHLNTPPPSFHQPPPSMAGVPPNTSASGPVKFNLPSKKGLGYNAFQQTLTPQQQQQLHQQPPQQQQVQQQPQQQQQQQQQQLPPQLQQQQQNQHFQQSNNNNNNKKKNKKNKTMLMNNNPWSKMIYSYMNQQQVQQQLSSSTSEKKSCDEGSEMGKGGGGMSNEMGASGSTVQERRMVKDVKSMTGLVADGDWPESLKVYVGRCFSRCQTELDKDQVEICLKGKLTQAANNGTLWTKDWEKEPLPSIHSEATVNLLSHMRTWGGSHSPPSAAATASDTSTPSSPVKSANNSKSSTTTPNNNRNTRFKKQSMSLGYSVKGGRSVRSRSHSDSRSRSRSYSRSKSRSHSRSRSRSRSRTPGYRRTGRRGSGRDGNKRRHSSESEDEGRGGFISFSPNKKVRNPAATKGRLGKKLKGKNKSDCYFYSEHGRMNLDPELSSNERLQKRAARFNHTATPAGVGGGPTQRNKNKKFNITKTINNSKVHGNRPFTTTTRSLSSCFSVDSEDIDWTTMHVIGTSTALEKPYLRLTTAPDPSTVRTVETLKKSLEHIKRQWVKNQDYRYACDQLKSLRQDLTIQGVRDTFTVQVYETHSRIALEKGDHEEFNQCQSQLKQLYAEVGGDNRLEFLAYRLLYYMFTKNTLDITSLMAGLTQGEKTDECVKFSLKLRAAWSLSNYHRFFHLYRTAPKMAAYLVDWFADRERKQAMRAMLKGYRPGSLDVSFIRAELALSTEEEWRKFEGGMSLAYTDVSKTKIDCKKSAVDVAAA